MCSITTGCSIQFNFLLVNQLLRSFLKIASFSPNMEITLFFVFTIFSFLPSVTPEGGDFVNNSCYRAWFDKSQFVSRYQAVASSPPLLRYLAEKDEIIYAVTRELFNSTVKDECYINAVSRYLTHFGMTTGALRHHFKETDESVIYRPNNVAWNPLATLQLVRRFRLILQPLVLSMDYRLDYQYELQKKIISIMWDLGWPTEEDLKSVTSAVLRIQHVYDLNTNQLANGILAGINTGVTFSADDCNAIGRQAMNDGYFALAVEWFEEALRKASEDIGDDSAVSRRIAENNVQMSSAIHDVQFDKSEVWDALFFRNKVSAQAPQRERRRTYEHRTWKGGQGSNFNEINYWGVCSGENYQTDADKAKLFCYYETQIDPAWRINPLKVEILSFQPLLVLQYYDLIGNRLMQRLKGEVSGQLARSVVYEGNSLVTSSIRTSLNSWVDDNYRSEYGYIPRTIELITGLRVKNYMASEKLQVAAYAAGSHYRVHLDALGSKAAEDNGRDQPTGDRIATFLFYLSDVVKGGGTAFPQSGIASSPRKGSAVLWFNLLRSAQLNDYTWHGSCPVVFGEKWIANKWMHTHEQMFIPEYKCGLKEDEIIHMKINGKPMSKFY